MVGIVFLYLLLLIKIVVVVGGNASFIEKLGNPHMPWPSFWKVGRSKSCST